MSRAKTRERERESESNKPKANKLFEPTKHVAKTGEWQMAALKLGTN